MKNWMYGGLLAVVSLLLFLFLGCSDDTTYIVNQKHHDHGKGHHKMDGLVLCLDGDSVRWVEPEDCLWPCPESHGECRWPCVVDCDD